MARYIDADALIEALQTDYDRQGVKADEMALKGLADISVKYSHGQFCFLNAIERVKDTPTANVVPKSEVDFLRKTIAKNAQQALEVTLEEIEKAKAEATREIFEKLRQKRNELWNKGNYTMFECWCKAEEELKKKYTEDQSDG